METSKMKPHNVIAAVVFLVLMACCVASSRAQVIGLHIGSQHTNDPKGLAKQWGAEPYFFGINMIEGRTFFNMESFQSFVEAVRADERQRLVDASWVMPSVRHACNFFIDTKVCDADEVREAIASLEAKLEQARQDLEEWTSTNKIDGHKYPAPNHANGCPAQVREPFTVLEYEGARVTMEPHEAAQMVVEGLESGTRYVERTVYLTRDQFERMDEFAGF